MLEDVDTFAGPAQRWRGWVVVHARGEPQIFLDFHLAFMKLGVGAAQSFLGLYLLGDVSEGKHPEPRACMFDCPVTDDDRYTSSALSRQKKLVPGVSLSERNTNLHGDKFPFLRRIEIGRVKTDQFLRR